MKNDTLPMSRNEPKAGAQALLLAALWTILALLAYLGLRHLNMDPRRGDIVRLDNVQMQGFEEEGGQLRSVGAMPAAFHLIEGDAAFTSEDYYVFSLEADTVPGAPAQLVVDLYGSDYDSPAQERQFLLTPGQHDLRVAGRFNTGRAPARAAFRVFYSGPPGLALSDVRIAHLPAWRVYVERLLGLTLAGAAVLLSWRLSVWLLGKGGEAGGVQGSSLLLAAAVVGCLRFVFQAGLPYWSGDEYLYKSIASGIWHAGRSGIPSSSQVLHDTNLPNLLYGYWIAPAFAFGEDFYLAIRAINAATMALGVIPLYFIAQRLMPARRALAAAVLGLALPSLFLGSFAVTEALYFPLFLFACHALLRMMEPPVSWRVLGLFGLCVGVLLNVRLNAIILIPAVVACTLISQRRTWRDWLFRPAWATSLVVAGVSYLLLKHLLTNPDADGLGFYENRSGGWASTAIRMALQGPLGTVKLLLGHFTLLALPFAPAIAFVLALPWMRMEDEDAGRRRNVAIALLLVVALSVAMAVAFTLGVAPQDIGGLGRWHSRYYFAALPLLVVLTFTGVEGWSWTRGARIAYVGNFFALMLSAVLFVVVFKLAADPWFGSTVDSMEAHWYKVAAWLFPWFLLAMFVAGGLVLAGRRAPAIALLLGWLAVANLATFRVLSTGPGSDDPQCGKLAYQLVARAPGSVAAVVSGRESLVDNLFWLPYLPREARFVEAGSQIDVSALPGDDYILSDPQVTITGAELIEHTGNCRIYRAN